MKKKYRFVVHLSLIFVIGICFALLPVHTMGKTEDYFLFSADNRIYCCKNNEGSLLLTSYDSTGKAEKLRIERFSADSALPASGRIILACNDRDMITLAESAGGTQHFYFVENASFKEGCIAVTDDRRLFCTDPVSEKTVFRCTALCNNKTAFELPDNVRLLFTDSASQQVFAVITDGVYEVETGRRVSGKVPSLPLKYGGGHYSDAAGKVYKFDTENGFAVLLETEYTTLCTTEDSVFAVDNTGRILRIGLDGRMISEYKTGTDVKEITAVKNSVGYLTADGQFVFVKINDFVSVREESSVSASTDGNSEPSDTHSGKKKNLPVTSSPEKEPVNSEPHESFVSRTDQESRRSDSTQTSKNDQASEKRNNGAGLTTGDYKIEDDLIIGVPPGTTAAKLKKTLIFDNGFLSIIDHKGSRSPSGKVGTGWRVEYDDGEKLNTYFIVVEGDITGEGNINSNDLRTLADMLIEDTSAENYIVRAADLDNDSRISVADLYLLQYAVNHW